MKIKSYKEWDYTLILIALIILIAALTSCTSSRVVYQMDHSGKTWKPAPKTSEITGYAVNR